MPTGTTFEKYVVDRMSVKTALRILHLIFRQSKIHNNFAEPSRVDRGGGVIKNEVTGLEAVSQDRLGMHLYIVPLLGILWWPDPSNLWRGGRGKSQWQMTSHAKSLFFLFLTKLPQKWMVVSLDRHTTEGWFTSQWGRPFDPKVTHVQSRVGTLPFGHG